MTELPSLFVQLVDGVEPQNLILAKPHKLSVRDAKRAANNKILEYDGPVGQAFINKSIRGQEYTLVSWLPCSAEQEVKTGIMGWFKVGGTAANLKDADELGLDIFRKSDQVTPIDIVPTGMCFPLMRNPKIDNIKSIDPRELEASLISVNDAQKKKQSDQDDLARQEREKRAADVLKKTLEPATEQETYYALRSTIASQVDLYRNALHSLKTSKEKIIKLHAQRVVSDAMKPELQDNFRDDIEIDLVKVCFDEEMRDLRRNMLVNYDTAYGEILE